MKLSISALALTAALALVGTPYVAAAQSPTSTGVVVEHDEGGSRWGAMVIADTMLGFGSFVTSDYSDDPYVAEVLSLRPSYRIEEIPGGASLILRQDLSYEFTDPGNVEGRSFDWADTWLWLIAPNLWQEEATGIRFGGEARATLPISSASQWIGKITGTTLGLRLTRPAGDFIPQLRFLATKHFYTDRAPAHGDEDFEDAETPSTACPSGEDYCRGGAYFTNWSIAAYGSLTYLISEKWSTTLVGQLSTGWRFEAPDDAFTSQAVDTTGERVVQTGAQRSADIVTTAIDVSYQHNARLAFSGGITTTQPLLSADNQSVRFLLADVDTPANNYSGFYFDVIATF